MFCLLDSLCANVTWMLATISWPDLVVPPLLAASEEGSFLASLLSQTWLWTKVALGIGLVIFVHELGHFLAAKTFGVKCEKFYVGFDPPLSIGPIKLPRTLGKFQYGETEYGIGIIPLGGYVKMLGQDDDPRKAEEEAKRIRTGGEDANGEEQLDPRSYPAKKVWQRMIIISAGVVMNVITGVMFATIAYFYGVPYTPAVVGGVSPGGAAWQAGIEPGGQVMSVAGLESDDQLHFNKMKVEIMTAGMDMPDKPIDVEVEYADRLETYELTPQSNPIEPSLRMIGIYGPNSNRLPTGEALVPGSSAATALADIPARTRVVAFDSTKIDESDASAINPLLDQLYSNPSEPVELTLVTKSDDGEDGQPFKVTVPPQSEKAFGIRFAPGPITALVSGGPAERAGVQVGDRIVAIDGDDNFDMYTLLLGYNDPDSEVMLTIRRGEGEQASEQTISVQPDEAMQTASPISTLGEAVGNQALGIAYQPSNKIAQVTVADSGLQVGDEVAEIKIQVPNEETKKMLKEVLSAESYQALTTGWEIGPTQPLTSLMETIQILPTGTVVKIKATRPPKGTVVEAQSVIESTDRFWYDRGLPHMVFASADRIQTADSLSTAIALGFREGKQAFFNVTRFLGMLVSGKVEFKFLGGPIRIAQMASYEAERGISSQLLFLTMLSMNLAIINFLPIPALDGGHMFFLTAEAVRGKKLDEALEMKLTAFGVIALLLLMLFVFANDIIQL